jgi:programmed cell death 6-interacting protein
MIALMMAQAHECIWQKAVMEHMKHGTVARLAIKVADFYDTFLQQSTPYIPEHWLRYAESKSNYFTAVAQYQKANEAISSGRYGEEIARLHLAKFSNAIATAHIRSDQQLLHPNLNEQILALEHAIERDLVRAEKDNDVVYMETIPEPNQLAPILRSDMVKPIIPNFVSNPDYWLVLKDRPNDPFFIKKPLFEKLVPFAVHQAVSVYSDKKDYIVQIEITAKIQQLTEEREKYITDIINKQ